MKRKRLSLLPAGLLGAAAVWFSVRCLATAYQLSGAPGLLPVLGLTGPGLTLLFARKRGRLWFWLTLLPLLALLLYSPLREALRDLGALILDRCNQGYQWYSGALLQTPGRLTEQALHLALGYLGLLALWPVCRSLGRGGGLGAMLPPCLIFSLCFILTDTVPDRRMLLCFTGSILLILLTVYLRRRAPELQGRGILALALPVALLLGLLALVFPQNTYRKQGLEAAIGSRLITLREDFEASALPGLFLPLHSPDETDLSSLGDAPDSTRTVMTVTAPMGGRLYLRGKAYEVYDGQSWGNSGDADWDPSLSLYDASHAEFQYWGLSVSSTVTQLHVRTVGVHDVIYTPYYLIQVPEGAAALSDLGWKNEAGATEYALEYTPLPVLQLSAPAELREVYEEAVRTRCTAIDKTTREALIQWWNDYADSLGLDKLPAPTPENLAQAVASTGTYSKHPSDYPGEGDFALWFLTQAKQGYCVHYATTATALLRAFGYPARYVTGYAALAKAGQETTVAVQDAHAWVEYYVEGLGWQPLEATPGLGLGSSQPTEPTETQPRPEETTAPVPEDTEPLPPTAQPTESGAAPTQTQPPTSGAATGRTDATLPGWVWILPGLMGLGLLLWLRRFLLRALRRRELDRAGVNDRICLLYRRYVRLCRLSKLPVEEEIYALAQKARFSQHVCAPEELAQALWAVREAEQRLKQKGVWTRFCCKWILGVL